MFRTLLVVLLVAVMTGSTVFAEEVRVGGGGASINTVFKPVKPHFEKATGLNMALFESTPKSGLIDLLQGKVDVAVAAVSLESMVQGVVKDGVSVDASTLQQVAVAKNRTAVFLHKDIPMKALPSRLLKDLFTGKVTNWKEIGGNDIPVTVVWGKSTPGQNGLFIKEVLEGLEVTKNAFEATNYISIKEKVASTPGAIGIDPIGLADDSVNIPDSPRVYSPVIMVTKGTPSAAVNKLIDYVKGEGKKYVMK
ncbi:MAG: substrate-binding domain-containing protein [Nitrospirae bacterium]|nr:substrate-binding domain-containing protein [Nitrospirota bacterium]